MKLLLTSGGLENNTIIGAMRDLVGKDFTKASLAFVPTAANLEAGDKGWLIKDLNLCQKLKFKEVDIVDISAVPQSIWQPRLSRADVIMVGGGNTYHLLYWLQQSGLAELLPELLKTKVYVGISAGSIVVTPSTVNAQLEKQAVLDIKEQVDDKGLGFVDFMFEPHINNKDFPELNFEDTAKQSKNWSCPVYALDDHCAVKVDGDNVEVVSEGEWKLFNNV